ncbi:response regulator [uncultured Draconibacterium sp.]|uniref:response regulator n=1 Tax=uncultured Draconibacterium sp. TaxID=1573823 RepID=UPI002AA7289A|nr:response regulator [uncultured Draconibacterium sp.]
MQLSVFKPFKSLLRFLLIPVLLIIFSITYLLLYRSIKTRTINEFNNEQLILARTASQGITSFFSDTRSDLTFLANLDDVINNTNTGKSILESYYQNHRTFISAISQVNSEGVITATFPKNDEVIGSNISNQKHVEQLLKSHRPVISDVFMSVQGYLSIAYHVPIFDKSKFKGSVAILIPMKQLGGLYLGNIKSRGTGQAWLLSENGTEIYCSNDAHTGKAFIENAHSNELAVELMNKIKQNTSGALKGIHEEKDLHGETVFNEQYITFYRTPLQNTYWTILISCHESDIFAALNRFRNNSFIAFILLFAALAFYFYSLVQVRSVIKEASKRRKAEETLLKSEEKFRKLFEYHAAVKLLVDPETTKIMDANNSAAKFYGWSRDQLKQMYLNQINTLSTEEIKKEVEHLLREGKNRFEFKHRLKNGELRDVEIYSSRVEIENKTQLHSIVHDITERKKAEKALIIAKEQAEESNRLKTAFLQNMSHEIRTPMNAIIGFSSLMADSFESKEQLKQFSEIINQSSNNLLAIIDDILDIAKIESGQLPLHHETFSLNDLFAELKTIFLEYQRQLNKPDVQFEIKECNGVDYIISDKGKLRQILINLMSNAYKFTDKGKIESGCKVIDNNTLEFYVHDTGTGIPTDKQSSVFERFTQLHNKKKQLHGGTGLGLSIVKGLVELLGGKIRLQSVVEKPDEGQSGKTTFYFTVSYQKAEEKESETKPAKNNDNYLFQQQTILLVEDNRANTRLIQKMLAETGLNILHTEYGKEAVDIAATKSPALVLMDIGLPDISGYEATKQIKASSPHIRIIAQTAYVSDDDKVKAYNAGCDDFVGKPISKEALLAVISKHLNGKKE